MSTLSTLMQATPEEGLGNALYWSIGGLRQHPGIALDMGLWPRALPPMGSGHLIRDI